MNYAGKFDATFGSGDTHSYAYVHSDSIPAHAPADSIVVPDAQLLFHGDFKRSGTDLILSGHEREFVVHDYFKGTHHKPLASPDGAFLTPNLVNALTGEVDVSQTDNAAQAGSVIGHVTKLVGSATVIRNGVSIILNMGDNVEKGDVVQSGSDSTVGITFIDGTVFGLSSNARMVLNEMVYDPNGSSNSSLMSLVAGTITFVAGETAKHGDMKIDTPVATMGIRGTAVLVEIDFSVPGQNGTPNTSFQVLVEPDGTTGSYVLFDKTTLQPIAIVDKAGVRIEINQYGVSQSDTQLSPDILKLINDVFEQKFSDSSNTKSTTNFTDSINPFLNGLTFGLKNGTTATIVNPITTNTTSNFAQTTPNFFAPAFLTDPGPPKLASFNPIQVLATTNFSVTELPGKTGDKTAIDSVGGVISYTDGSDPAAVPTVSSITFGGATFHGNAAGGTPNAQQLAADIAAVSNLDLIGLIASPGNTDTQGSFTWLYAVHDNAFDFLAAGETLTLTFVITVDNNYEPHPTSTPITITVTIVGTNDAPTFTSAAPATIALSSSSSQQASPLEVLPSSGVTSGHFQFSDVDLSDKHSVVVSLETPVLTDSTGAVVSNDSAMIAAFQQAFQQALTAVIATDSTGTGTGGVIDWTFNTPEGFDGDIVPPGDTMTLTYDVTVTDPFGASSTEKVTVTIVSSASAFIWVATPDGTLLWSDDQNWEAKSVPTAADDAIIITNQSAGLTPAYPATIDSDTNAAVHSLTMNDLNVGLDTSPKLIIQGSLAVGVGGISLNADSIIDNEGSMTVAGAFNFHDNESSDPPATVTLTNSGTLVLSGGGDFAGPADVTNSGKFELSAGTLTVMVDVANFDGDNPGTFQIDYGATLVLSGSTFTGGFINNYNSDGGGFIHVTGASSLVDLTLTNGAVTVDDKLTLDGSTVSGTTITVDSVGSVEFDDRVKLEGGATIQGQSDELPGVLTNLGTLEIAGPATLLNDSLTNTGQTVQVDHNQTLTLSGTAIAGGFINNYNSNGGGFIHVTGASSLIDLTLTNGAVTVDDQLTLDGSTDSLTVSGTTITVDKFGSVEFDNTVKLEGGATIQGQSGGPLGALTNLGTLEIAGPATLLNDSLTNTDQTVQVDYRRTLTLSGTTITGGFINDYDTTGGGFIHVTGASSLVDLTLTNGAVTVDAKLTLDGSTDSLTVSGTTITVDKFGSVEFDNTVKLEGGATIQGQSGGPPGALTNLGTLEIAGPATLLNVTLTNTHQTVQVDGGMTLNFGNSTLSGGTLTVNGTLVSTGTSFITGATINNKSNLEVAGGTLTIDPAPVINTGTILVTDDSTLVLNGETVFNSVFNPFTKVVTNGTIQIDAVDTTHFSTLALEGSGIEGGLLSNSGLLQSSGTSDITGVAFTNAGTTDVVNGTLTLNSTTVSGGGNVTVESGSVLDLVNADLIGGTLGGSGKITTAFGNNASTLNGVTLKSGSKVTASTGVLNLTGTLTATGAEIDANTGPGVAIDLESLILLGGTLGGLGAIATVGALNTFNGVAIASGTTVSVTDDTALDLKGTIGDAGTIALNSSGDSTQIDISGSVLLNGSGHVTLSDNAHNAIVSDGSAATLDNFDTITGAGTIGDSHLTLSNSGTIEATGSNALIIDTGVNPAHGTAVGSLLVTNTATGVLEAAPGHTLQIDDNVLNDGLIVAESSGSNSISAVDITGNVENDWIIQAGSTNSHSASSVGVTASVDISGNITGTGSIDLYDNATVEIGGTVSKGQTVTFENAGGGSTLILDDSHGFQGTIVGLTEYSTEDLENHVDLKDLAYVRGEMSTHYNQSLDTLTISDGSDSVTLHVTPSAGMDPAFEFAPDKTGGTLIDDPLASGPMTIDSGQTLDITGAGTGTVTFTNSNGNTGELVLEHSTEFTGVITGFTGDGTLANSDLIDLQDINFAKLTTDTYTENANGDGGTLTLSDGTTTTSINFSGDYSLANFNFSSDGNGGTLLSEAPAPTGQIVVNLPGSGPSVTITNTTPMVTPSSSVTDTQTANGAMDQFVFAPTTSTTPAQHTIINFNPNQDTINLQQFGNIVSAADLIANHTTQVGNDTLIAIDSNDSILLKNVQAANLHASDFLVHA